LNDQEKALKIFEEKGVMPEEQPKKLNIIAEDDNRYMIDVRGTFVVEKEDAPIGSSEEYFGD